MTRIARLLVAGVLVGGMVLTACGGDDDDSASAGASATISDKDVKAAARAAGVDEACVEGVRAYGALAGAAGAAFSPAAGDLDKNVAAFQKYADSGPSDIRAELRIVADAYEAYVKAIVDSGWSPSSGKPPTQEQAAALSAAGEKIDDDSVKAAGDKISKYFDEQCTNK